MTGFVVYDRKLRAPISPVFASLAEAVHWRGLNYRESQVIKRVPDPPTNEED